MLNPQQEDEEEVVQAERSIIRIELVAAMTPHTKLLSPSQRSQLAETVMTWGVESFSELAQVEVQDLVDIGLQPIAAKRIVAAAAKAGHYIEQEVVEPASTGEYAAHKDAIEIGSLLGGGNFGEVYQGTLNGLPVALKKMKLSSDGQEYTDNSLKREMLLQQEVAKLCGQVVRVHCLWRQREDLYLVMELCEAGSLEAVPAERKTPLWLTNTLLSVATALAQLHQAGFVHRDLSTRNILMRYPGPVAVLTDFGLSGRITQLRPIKEYPWRITPPEAARDPAHGQQWGPAGDMFSFGCLVWELSTGRKPWPNLSRGPAPVGQFALEHNAPPLLPPAVWELALQCTAESPGARPTAEAASKHLSHVAANVTPAVVSLEAFDYIGASSEQASLPVSSPTRLGNNDPTPVLSPSTSTSQPLGYQTSLSSNSELPPATAPLISSQEGNQEAQNSPQVEAMSRVNIWEEIENETNCLCHTENGQRKLRAGTLNVLILRLTQADAADLSFCNAFLATYQSFVSPQTLFSKLVQRYEMGSAIELPGAQTGLSPVQLRVVNVLKLWVARRTADFDRSLGQRFEEFTAQLAGRGERHAPMAQQLAVAAKQLEVLQQQKMPPEPVPGLTASQSLLAFETLLTFSERDLAQHLTKLEFEIFAKIQPPELLNMAWRTPNIKHRAPNVLAMAERLNVISHWVAFVILSQKAYVDRVRAFEMFIRIAQICYEINSFNSAMSILSGFENAAVHRLGFTKEGLGASEAETLAQLSRNLSSAQAYKLYREQLRRVKPPLLPFLGVYLTDITFVEEGNPDFVELNGQPLINFRKRELLFAILQEIRDSQRLDYADFILRPEIIKVLAHPPTATDEELWATSLRLEPRQASREEIIPSTFSRTGDSRALLELHKGKDRRRRLASLRGLKDKAPNKA